MKRIDFLIQLVEDIYELLKTQVKAPYSCKELECPTCHPKELEEWMGKQEVIDYLQISERTYRRQVESGLLKPMNIGGGDFFFKSQLLEALLESRRKGRV